MSKAFSVVMLGFSVLAALAQGPRKETEDVLTPALIMGRIARTSAEGLDAIAKAKHLMPEFQSHRSAKTLEDAVEERMEGPGQFRIDPVGWEAIRSEGSRWKVLFYFKDEEGRYAKAAWNYDHDRNVLMPADFSNAMRFWVRRSENKRP